MRTINDNARSSWNISIVWEDLDTGLRLERRLARIEDGRVADESKQLRTCLLKLARASWLHLEPAAEHGKMFFRSEPRNCYRSAGRVP